MKNNRVISSCETRTVIGGCEYRVVSIFNENSRETAEEKLIRLIKESVNTKINNTEVSVLRSN
jgi:hypothetical protein